MNNFKLYCIFVLSLSFFCFSIQNAKAQSAWTKKKGKLFSQISYSTIPNYSEIFNDKDYITSRSISDNTLQLYGEYGVNDNLTLLVNVPFKLIKTGDAIENSTVPLSIVSTRKSGFGNIQIGLKHNIYRGKMIVSGQLTVEANTSFFDKTSGIRSGYDAWTFTPTVNVGKGYENYYFQGFIGADIRTNDYSSNFRIGGEFGLTSIKKTTLIVFVDIIESFNNGDIILPQTSLETALYINNQDYAAYGLKGLYSLTDNLGFSVGFGGAFSANNVAKQAALSAGLFFKI
ncbi:hypothetical protein [uncultured Lacinutrix sp.]|uniref:hypothetical protein n=1 Tax=uncultured Lacinutrix sp. TaxID=574032 RepID=UPI002628BD04|nr:hypothetical protein [uncultured Lacinutrix sp.]